MGYRTPTLSTDLLLAPRPRHHGSGTITDDERWTHARRLLHDTSIDRCDRFAGLLLLLFAQPSRRIVTLRTDAITQRIDNRAVSLALGTEPVILPTLIGQLALDQSFAAPAINAATVDATIP